MGEVGGKLTPLPTDKFGKTSIWGWQELGEGSVLGRMIALGGPTEAQM